MKATKVKKLTVEDDQKKPTERKSKKVMIDDFRVTYSTGSIMHSTPYERMMREINTVLDTRAQLKIYEEIDNDLVNLTPKPLSVPNEQEDFLQLDMMYNSVDADVDRFRRVTSSIMRQRSSRGVGFQMSVEDIMSGIGTDRIDLDNETRRKISWSMPNKSSSDSFLFIDPPTNMNTMAKQKLHRKFIRIILRKTELTLLFEQHGNTAIKNTDDGNNAEIDNKEYDYLTIGRGKVRRRSEAEAQTAQTLFKSREVNTNKLQTKNVASFVSYYEMFDTYKRLDNIKYDSLEGGPQKLHISHSKSQEEQFTIMTQLPSFHFASIIMGRLLAGNIYGEGQRRFRNMTKVSRTVDKISYKYSLKTLFTFQPTYKDNERKAVADMCYCPTNGDILAVAYGIYSYQAAKLPTTGEVCIWSIKNPCDPERFYSYAEPVVSVEFSPYMPTLLAIGLFDGSVEVRDITYFNQPPVAISKRTSAPGVDPVLAIKWFKLSTTSDNDEIDPFLALSEDCSVTQFRIINSPYLSTFKLMSLKRLEGNPEGLDTTATSTDLMQHSDWHPQGLGLTKHPIQPDIYYILTDEGCIRKCSTNYQHHYIQALKTHEGSVNHMDFSPWSPKLFLTCGNDWCLRIWMDEILEPLITMKNLCQPYNWAAWSRTNSTILIAINRNQCDIWDLRRNILKPVSSTVFSISSNNTTGIFSLDGNSILIGNERGQVLVNALEEMPFPPYYQYDVLETAIYNAVSNNPNLFIELKSIGYFGHPNKGFVKSP